MKRPVSVFAARLLFWVTALCGASSFASAQAVANPQDAARIARIENGLLTPVAIQGHAPQTYPLATRMEHFKVPGVSIAFFEHGKIQWMRNYGFADVALKKPVTPDTLFQAGSISKPTTALAALHLVQQGKLNLDQDVNQKLVAWKVPENDFTKAEKVTLRRILSHSAGLTVHGFPGYAAGEPVPSLVQVLQGEKPANTEPVRADVVPGTLWRYSGGGFAVLQLMLNETTHQPFPQMMQQLVLGPAGMSHSTFEQPLLAQLQPLAAVPYDAKGIPVQGGAHIYPEMAAAGLWSTPSDLAKMAMEVQAEYAGKSNKILSRPMMKQMLSVQKDPSGLGFFIKEESGHPRFQHQGQDDGFVSDVVAYTDGSGEGVVIMTNGDRGADLIAEIQRAIAKEYSWPDYQPKVRAVAKVAPAVLQEYVGEYDIPGMTKLTVSEKDGHLFVLGPDDPQAEEMYPESDTQFFILSQDLTAEFVKNDKDAVNKMVIHVEEGTIEARKIP